MKNKEVWRPIITPEGTYEEYEISSYGRVRSLKFNKIRILSLEKGNYDFLKIMLSEKGRRKKHMVHHLVAQAFVPNVMGYSYIEHINGINSDNRLENLRWIAHKPSSNDELAKKQVSKKNKLAKNKLARREKKSNTRELLIRDFLKAQEFMIKDMDNNIIAIGKEIENENYLFYELSTNKFYINTEDDEEYYIDNLLNLLFDSLDK